MEWRPLASDFETAESPIEQERLTSGLLAQAQEGDYKEAVILVRKKYGQSKTCAPVVRAVVQSVKTKPGLCDAFLGSMARCSVLVCGDILMLSLLLGERCSFREASRKAISLAAKKGALRGPFVRAAFKELFSLKGDGPSFILFFCKEAAIECAHLFIYDWWPFQVAILFRDWSAGRVQIFSFVLMLLGSSGGAGRSLGAYSLLALARLCPDLLPGDRLNAFWVAAVAQEDPCYFTLHSVSLVLAVVARNSCCLLESLLGAVYDYLMRGEFNHSHALAGIVLAINLIQQQAILSTDVEEIFRCVMDSQVFDFKETAIAGLHLLATAAPYLSEKMFIPLLCAWERQCTLLEALVAAFFYFSTVFTRWTMPRIRTDQSVDLPWKLFSPVPLELLISIHNQFFNQFFRSLERQLFQGIEFVFRKVTNARQNGKSKRPLLFWGGETQEAVMWWPVATKVEGLLCSRRDLVLEEGQSEMDLGSRSRTRMDFFTALHHSGTFVGSLVTLASVVTQENVAALLFRAPLEITPSLWSFLDGHPKIEPAGYGDIRDVTCHALHCLAVCSARATLLSGQPDCDNDCDFVLASQLVKEPFLEEVSCMARLEQLVEALLARLISASDKPFSVENSHFGQSTFQGVEGTLQDGLRFILTSLPLSLWLTAAIRMIEKIRNLDDVEKSFSKFPGILCPFPLFVSTNPTYGLGLTAGQAWRVLVSSGVLEDVGKFLLDFPYCNFTSNQTVGEGKQEEQTLKCMAGLELWKVVLVTAKYAIDQPNIWRQFGALLGSRLSIRGRALEERVWHAAAEQLQEVEEARLAAVLLEVLLLMGKVLERKPVAFFFTASMKCFRRCTDTNSSRIATSPTSKSKEKPISVSSYVQFLEEALALMPIDEAMTTVGYLLYALSHLKFYNTSGKLSEDHTELLLSVDIWEAAFSTLVSPIKDFLLHGNLRSAVQLYGSLLTVLREFGRSIHATRDPNDEEKRSLCYKRSLPTMLASGPTCLAALAASLQLALRQRDGAEMRDLLAETIACKRLMYALWYDYMEYATDIRKEEHFGLLAEVKAALSALSLAARDVGRQLPDGPPTIQQKAVDFLSPVLTAVALDERHEVFEPVDYHVISHIDCYDDDLCRFYSTGNVKNSEKPSIVLSGKEWPRRNE